MKRLFFCVALLGGSLAIADEAKVTRAEVTNVDGLSRQARLVPAIADGKPSGFKIYAIQPGSIFDRVGLQNGDTVQTVSGLDVSSADKALEAYSKLKQATEIDVGILRAGKPLTIHITVVEK